MDKPKYQVDMTMHDDGPGGHHYTADSWNEDNIDEAKEKCQLIYNDFVAKHGLDICGSDMTFSIDDVSESYGLPLWKTYSYVCKEELEWIKI